MTDRIVIDVDRDGWTTGLQLNIAQVDANGGGHGYRLAGPKYNGSSTNLLRADLDERDAAEIRQYLDAVFPPGRTPAVVPVVDRETASHVLWVFGQPGGYRPGDYTHDLLTLLSRSDVRNTARFATAFPVEAEAVRMAKDDEDGIERLRAIARADLCGADLGPGYRCLRSSQHEGACEPSRGGAEAVAHD